MMEDKKAAMLMKLVSFPIFNGMAPELLEALADIVETHSYPAGEIIFREGDEPDYLYVLESGQVQVLKDQERLVIATLNPGEDFGSMPLFDKVTRSATIRALTPVNVIRIAFDALDQLGEQHARMISEKNVALTNRKISVLSPLHQVLTKNLFKQQTLNLQRTNEVTVNALKHELSETQTRLATTTFLTYVIIVMLFYGFFLRDAVSATHVANSTVATSTILLGYLTLLFFMIKHSPYPLAFYGLNLYRWRHALWESLWWSILFIAATTFFKWLIIHLLPEYRTLPLFEFDELTEKEILFFALYGLFAPVQEFIARGILQSSFQKFLSGKWVTLKAILFSTLMFSGTHLHLSSGFALLIVIPSFFWGVMYARQKTLLGVMFSHIFIGEWVLMILGFPGFR